MFEIPTLYCTNGSITVFVKNKGSVNLETEHFITAKVDGVDVRENLELVNIPPTNVSMILEGYNCAGSCSQGYHSIYLATNDRTVNGTVNCS